MSKKNFGLKAIGLVTVFSSGLLAACGGEGFGVDESIDMVSNEATGDLTKADGVPSVCPAGTMKVELDAKRTDSAGRLKPVRISVCAAKNSAGQPLVSATTPTAPRSTTSDVRTAGVVAGGGGASIVCKEYGSIFCCWNSKQGWCVSANQY